MAPVAYHRMVFRQNRKAELVRTASRLAGAGMASMGLAMIGSVFVVMDVVIDLGAAIAAAAAVGVLCVALWYLLPLRHRRLTSKS
jgi:hypothetical protein